MSSVAESPLPLPLRVLQFAVLLSSSGFAGIEVALSYFLVPRLLESPTPVLLKQMSRHVELGRAVLRPVALGTALGYFGLSYGVWRRAGPGGERAALLYAVAGALSMAMAPYTVFLVLPINDKVVERAREAGVLDEDGTSAAKATAVAKDAENQQEQPHLRTTGKRKDDASKEQASKDKTSSATDTAPSGSAGAKGILRVFVEDPDTQTTHALVDRWGVLNLGRAVIMTLSAAIGLAAAI